MADDDLRWRLGAQLPGHDYRIFTTHFREGAHPHTGAPKRFSLIDAVDWVNVIALTDDEQVVLVRQHRIGTDEICLEIPGGMIDRGEAPQTAAARELREETGFTGGTWRQIGRVAPNPAIMNNHLYTFVVRGVARTAEPELDAGEVIEILTLPLPDVLAAIRDGRIDHALVVAAFAHYLLA